MITELDCDWVVRFTSDRIKKGIGLKKIIEEMEGIVRKSKREVDEAREEHAIARYKYCGICERIKYLKDNPKKIKKENELGELEIKRKEAYKIFKNTKVEKRLDRLFG